MWRNLPLSTKLLCSLVLLQTTTLAAGVMWLGHWTERTRIAELTRRLDAQGDALEGFVTFAGGGPRFDGRNETVRELSEDKTLYFEFQRPDGQVFARSGALTPALSQDLRARFRKRDDLEETFYEVEASNGRWIVQSEPLFDGVDAGRAAAGYAHIAIHAQPTLDEIARFRRNMALAALGVLTLTSLGSGVVISLSTRNLRRFAQAIRQVRPPAFDGVIAPAPLSAEEQLLFDSFRGLVAAARSSSEAQRLFIAHASHELKSPIAAAMAALEVTLAKPRAAEDYRQTCLDVLVEVKTLRRLSAAVLDLARIGPRSPAELAARADLRGVAGQVVERWSRVAAERGITIRFAPDDGGTPALVAGDPGLWEIILSNVLDNAIKYSRDGQSIDVAIAAPGAEVVATIADRGCGMGPTELARLGEVFFRADEARTGSDSFGLGFAHAKTLLEGVGGRFEVASAAGKGTSVAVHAPRAQN